MLNHTDMFYSSKGRHNAVDSVLPAESESRHSQLFRSVYQILGNLHSQRFASKGRSKVDIGQC